MMVMVESEREKEENTLIRHRHRFSLSLSLFLSFFLPLGLFVSVLVNCVSMGALHLSYRRKGMGERSKRESHGVQRKW